MLCAEPPRSVSTKHRSCAQVSFSERPEPILPSQCQNITFVFFYFRKLVSRISNKTEVSYFRAGRTFLFPSFAWRTICEVLSAASSKAMLRRRCSSLWRVSLLFRTCFLLLREIHYYLVCVILTTSNSSSFGLSLLYLSCEKNYLIHRQTSAFSSGNIHEVWV